MDQAVATFGQLLRRSRAARGVSQMALALDAEVSARHLSWLESGKAQPSRAMVLRLAERLELPPRERNAWLHAAGYAPMYGESASLDEPRLARARAALQRLLDAHQPWPALAVDRHWNLVSHNATVARLLALVGPPVASPPVNVMRLLLHPQGLAPRVENLGAWHEHSLARLERQIRATHDPALVRLRDELRGVTSPPPSERLDGDVALPLVIGMPEPIGRLSFLTTLTVFGAPHDLLLAELAIETLLPADEATATALRGFGAASTTGTGSPA